jgi:hypothetical protein
LENWDCIEWSNPYTQYQGLFLIELSRSQGEVLGNKKQVFDGEAQGSEKEKKSQ